MLSSQTFILAGCHVRASAGDLAVHGALIPCVCVCVCVCVCLRVCPVSNSFFITPRIGTRFVLLTGKHPVVGQLPRVSFSALPGQSSDRPNLPPHPSAITALFLDRSLVVVHLTGHDQIMTVEILGTMAIASPQSGRATARGLPEVFHVSARSRWITYSGVAGGGVCVVSEGGRGPGAVPPGNFFHFPPQNNGVL